MATSNEGFETPANGAALTTTNCPTLFNVGKTANNAFVCSTAQHAAGTKSARITSTATADTAPLRMDLTASATPHFRIYYQLDRLPTSTEANMYALSARTSASVAVAYVRILSNGSVQLRDGNSLASGSGATSASGLLSAATLFRFEWFIDVAGGTQTCRVFIGSNAHGTTPDTTLTGGYSGANVGQIIAGWNNNMASMGLYADDFGYDTAGYMGPSVVSTGLTANAGADQTNRPEGVTVNLSGSATGGSGIYTYTWTQTAGTTMSVSGSGANRSFVVPALSANETLTFQLSVNDGTSTVTDSINVGVLRQVVPNAGGDQTGAGTGNSVTLTASAVGGSGGYVYTWTQIAGTSVTLSGTGASRSFTVPTNTGETLTFQVSVTDSAGSTAHTDTVDVGIVPASSSTGIALLTKNFNGRTVGATPTADFTAIQGTSTALYSNDPALEGDVSVRFTGSGANPIIAHTLFTAAPLVYRLLMVRFEARPNATDSFFNWFTGGNNGTRVGDIRMTTTGTLQIRDGAAAAVSGTTVLALNTNYYIGLKIQPGSSTGHVMKIYSSAGALLETRTTTATNVGATTIDDFHIGDVGGNNMVFVVDDLRGDSSVELFPPSTAIVANAGADQTNKVEGATVGLAGSASGGNGVYSYAWTQLSGPSVTLTGSGANRTFVVPGSGPGTAVLQLTVTDTAGSTAGVDTVSVGILAPVVANAGADQANVEPYATVTLTASASGGVSPYTYTWQQISGAAVTLSSTSGATVTYAAPGVANGDVAIFRVTATGSGGSTPHTDDVQVTTLSHDNFYSNLGTMRPYRIWRRSGSSWV